MHIDLTFMEAIGLVVVLLGGAFALLKIAAYQFSANITAKFASIEGDMLKQAADLTKSIEDKFSTVSLTTLERIKLERMEIELQTEKRHSFYLEKFSTKDEASIINSKHDKVIDEIFRLLREINEKFANTVSKEEFNRGGQQ
jgi:hypothetical protein